MRIIKIIIVSVILLSSTILIAQTTDYKKELSFKTNLGMSYYHFGGYKPQPNIYYLEQYFDYRLSEKYSLGAGFGINKYPFLLALPVFIEGKKHFSIKNNPSYVSLSYGRNIKVGSVFFNSSRTIGSFGMNFKISEKLSIEPSTGFSFIWDQYGGGDISLLFGVGLRY